MKKILIILFIISNTLLFFSVLHIFEDKEYSEVEGYYTYDNSLSYSAIEFNNTINNFDRDELFSYLKGISIKHNVTFVSMNRDIYGARYNYYIYSNLNIDKLLGLVTDKSLNFNKNDKEYYSNQNEGVNFYLINKKLDVTIKPLSYVIETKEGIVGHFNIIANDEQTLQNILEQLKSKYGTAINGILKFDMDPVNIEDSLSNTAILIMLFSFSLTLLIFFMFIYHSSKKVAILKMQGLSIFSINKELYGKTIIYILISIFLSVIILCFTYIGVINAKTIPLYSTLLKYVSYEIIFLFICIVLSNILLALIPVSQLVKNNNFNIYLMNVNYGIKIVMLFIVVNIITPYLIDINDTISNIRYLNHFENDIYQYQYSPMSLYEYRFDNYANILSESSSEYWQKGDKNIIMSNKILARYHDAYDQLNSKGAIYCQPSAIHFGNVEELFPSLDINTNYLKKYPVKDANGNIITEASLSQFDITYLIPEEYLKKHPQKNLFGDTVNEYTVISIANQQDIFDFSCNLDKRIEPYVLAVYNDEVFRMGKTPFQNVYIEGSINEALKGTYFYNKIEVENMETDINSAYSYFIEQVLSYLGIVIPTLLILGCIVFQYCYLYMQVHSKRLYIKALLGVHHIRIFYDLIIESLIALLLPAAFIYMTGGNTSVIWMLLIMDSIICSISIWRFSRKNIADGLKGGVM